jgi:hypothetical protein
VVDGSGLPMILGQRRGRDSSQHDVVVLETWSVSLTSSWSMAEAWPERCRTMVCFGAGRWHQSIVNRTEPCSQGMRQRNMEQIGGEKGAGAHRR